MCEWVNADLCCKVLWVVQKTGKVQYKYSPFTIQGSSVILQNHSMSCVLSFLWKRMFSCRLHSRKGEEADSWLAGSAKESSGVSRVMVVPNYFPGCMEKRRSWPVPLSVDWVMCCSLPLAWTDSAPNLAVVEYKWSQLTVQDWAVTESGQQILLAVTCV